MEPSNEILLHRAKENLINYFDVNWFDKNRLNILRKLCEISPERWSKLLEKTEKYLQRQESLIEDILTNSDLQEDLVEYYKKEQMDNVEVAL